MSKTHPTLKQSSKRQDIKMLNFVNVVQEFGLTSNGKFSRFRFSEAPKFIFTSNKTAIVTFP